MTCYSVCVWMKQSNFTYVDNQQVEFVVIWETERGRFLQNFKMERGKKGKHRSRKKGSKNWTGVGFNIYCVGF